MARGIVIAGAVLVAIGGGALGFAVTRGVTGGMTPDQTAAMASAVGSLDGDIKAARGEIATRAKTLAESSELRTSIGTDSNTTMERIGKEIAFKPDASEVLELVQRPKAGGALTTLMLLPDDKMKSPHDGTPGAYVDLMGDQLLVTQVVEVTPADKTAADTLAGFVTASKKLSLGPAIDKLTKAGIVGRLEIGGAKLAIGAPPADTSTMDSKAQPLESQPGATLTAYAPPKTGGMPVPIAIGGGVGAGVGVLLLLVGMMGGKKGTQSGLGAGSGTTVLSGGYPGQGAGQTRGAGATPFPGAAGSTPFPVSGHGPTGFADLAGSSTDNMAAGQQMGRWEIIRRIGSGGMADVYLAHAKGEAGFEKQVALKVMHGHLARNERAVQHFLDEARTASRVVHPNVIAIQDLGKIGNDYVIVMDYVDGADLERLLMSARAGGRQVPIEVALGIMCRICDGLNAAHTAVAPDGSPMAIIHRDVKSANVLVSKQGAVKVMDFGIAKAATQSHMTVAGETKGTPSMMAPEQRVGEVVDVRADVYSAAAVGFEILTGHGVNLDLAALAHLGVDNWPHLPLPSSLRQGLPEELDALLLGAMAFERDKRPASCAVFEESFEQIIKKYGLTTNDKEIGRWVESEIVILRRDAAVTGEQSASTVAQPQ